MKGPDRPLPARRTYVARGGERLQRITWDQALDTIAARIGKLREAGRPERFAIQVGRDKTQGLTQRFLSSVGSPHALNRRSICSSNNRLGSMTLFGTIMDWGAPDLERTRYVLNFGSNLMEAHQGGFGGVGRMQDARIDRGARLVTFEVRPSATASVSDEWFAVKPGSDGAIAMGMAHVIVEEGLADRAFWDRWCNITFEEICAHLKPFTPEVAAQVSGVPAADIRRLAREFAKASPACTTILNRGIAKHVNGIHASRAVFLLDILVGNVGKPGGCGIVNRGTWKGAWGQEGLPVLAEPSPRPPKPPFWAPGMAAFDELPTDVKKRWARLPEEWKSRYQGELITPVEYPLSWQWQVMRVGQMNYPWIREGRARIDTLFTYVFNGAYGYPEAKVCRDVLLDEQLIPFHVAIDIGYSETSALADILLPEASALERFDAQVSGSWDFRPITGLRQPLVAPPGEAKSVWWIYRELARRLGPEVAKYWDFPDEESYYKAWYESLPISWEELRRRGIWSDPLRVQDFELFERPLSAADLEGSTVDPVSGRVTKALKGKATPIGIVRDGKPVRGFASRSGLIEVRQEAFALAGPAAGLAADHPNCQVLPTWFETPAHAARRAGELNLVTFKWNVHTQGRTAHHKYQAEIVHDNPIWIAPATAKRLGFKDGQWVEVRVRRPVGDVWGADEKAICGAFKQRLRCVPGMSPDTLAVSHHLGHWEHGPLAQGRQGSAVAAGPGMDSSGRRDRDLEANVWWMQARGGPGMGVYINDAFPIAPTPLSGGQAWYDCVCTIHRL